MDTSPHPHLNAHQSRTTHSEGRMVGSLELGNARKESGKGGKGKGRARGRRPKWLLVRAGWDLPRVSPSQLKPNPRSWNPR